MNEVASAAAASRRTRRLKDLSIAAAVAVPATIVVGAATQNRHEVLWWVLAAELTVGTTILIAGQVAWGRRPESRVGPLLVIAGLLRFAMVFGVTGLAPLFTISLLVGGNYQNVLAHAIITFPGGRVRNRWERLLVIGVYTLGFFGFTAVTFFRNFIDCPCPENLLLISDSPGIADGLGKITTLLSVVLAGGFAWYAVHRYRRSTPAAKHALAPVYAAGALGGVFTMVGEASDMWFPQLTDSVAWFWMDQVVTILVPIGFLVGLHRTRVDRTRMGDLVVELGADSQAPGALEDAIADRLHDPSLELAYRVGDGYVDDEGRPVELPSADSRRAVTTVEADGETIAALIHDEVLRHEPEVVDAVVAAARLAIANERLRAEIRAQLEEVRASRQRIVEAGDLERRRVERNLHDGAQQRLVSLSLSLSMLRERLDGDPSTETAVAEAASELRTAIAELRELARGIHPAILTEEGLEAAVGSLADRSPMPVTVSTDLDGRLPERVEAAAYFVVSEALANVAKYAEARSATVALEHRDGTFTVAVTDDGIGGADLGRGSGLLGLGDRVAAVGGTLRVDSPPGDGTRVIAEIPIDG